MSNDDLFGAPAGWYPDPLGLPQLRWWNNHAWTEQTSAARQPMVVQDTKFAWADDEAATRREESAGASRTPAETAAPTAETLRELEPPRAFAQVNTTPAPAAAAPTAPAAPAAPAAAPAPERVESLYQPDPIVEPIIPAGPSLDSIFDAKPTVTAPPVEALDALFGAKESRRTQTRVKTPILTAEGTAATAVSTLLPSSTGPAWIIALVPLLQLVISLLLLTALGQNGSQFIYIGILAVPYFLVVGLAYLDNSILKKSGHARPAHWAWAFLSAPVYLLMRARAVIKETGHGIGPVLTWFGTATLHIASVVAIPGVIIALLPAIFTAQIQDSVASDANLIAGTQMSVTCPVTPPVLPGETIVCKSVTTTGNKFDITVTLKRSNGWISWQVIDWGKFNTPGSDAE